MTRTFDMVTDALEDKVTIWEKQDGVSRAWITANKNDLVKVKA